MYQLLLSKTPNYIVTVFLIFGLSLSIPLHAKEKPEKEPWQIEDHFQTNGKVVPLDQDRIHDPTNDSAMFALQTPVEAMSEFPRDSAGLLDWVQTLREGHILPRSDISGEAPPLKPTDLDIVFTDTASMPNVLFSHKAHTEWLACSNCHPDVFKKQKGSSNIKMDDILKGQYCGLCHGKIAFAPTKNCMRCHSVQPTKK